MARIAGINLPTGKRVPIALTYIHGIGTNTAIKICTELKIPFLTKLNELDDIQLSSIRDYIDSKLGTGVNPVCKISELDAAMKIVANKIKITL